MKTLKAALRAIFLIVTAALLAGFVIVSILRRSGLPDYDGEAVIAGLTGDIKVFRDERGVAHIYAGNEHDLYFISGYISAQERLWQMDLIRRGTRGQLAEIFGPEYVETDHFLRSLNMPGKSAMVLEKEDSTVMSCLEAYADGVNAWINKCGKKLPAEFRILKYKPAPWTPQDITNIIGFMGWDLASGNLTSELRNYRRAERLGAEKTISLLPDWDLVDDVVFPGFELNEYEVSRSMSFIASMEKLKELGIFSLSGSNNWAVGSKRSETGKPILSNDMHLGLNVPGYWMQMHQVIPGKLDVTGVMIPGEPFIVAGHNERIAWGITNLMVDDIDIYVEKTDSAGTSYMFNGQWFPFTERTESIKVRGGETVAKTIMINHRGPVISPMKGINDAVLTMRWSGFDYSDEIKGVFLLNRAANWDDFRSAVSNFRSISLNINYADTEGNIGINTAGGVPVRKGTGQIPRNGQTDEFDWKGYVPFDLLPSSYNPPECFVSSANQRTVSSDYPFYIAGDFAMPYRIMRLRQMAAEKEILGIDDFKRMVTDNHSAYAEILTPVILKAASGINNPGVTERKMIEALQAWDYCMDAGKVAPSIFEFTRIMLAHNLMADELSDLYGSAMGQQHDYHIYKILKEGPDEWVDNVNTQQTETFNDIIIKSISDAADTLTATYGKNLKEWQWGKIHSITLNHPLGTIRILDKIFRLNSKKYGIGGSYHTVEPYNLSNNFRADEGASERHIFNTADWDKSLTVIPTGTSGIPGSPYYLSQTDAYINNRFFADPFSERAVQNASKHVIVYHGEEE